MEALTVQRARLRHPHRKQGLKAGRSRQKGGHDDDGEHVHLEFKSMAEGGSSFAAGAVSGFVTRTVVAPLDVVKIRLQVCKGGPSLRLQLQTERRGGHYRGIVQTMMTVAQEEGLSVPPPPSRALTAQALWRGNVAAELLWVSYCAVQFGLYDAGRSYFGPAKVAPPPPFLTHIK